MICLLPLPSYCTEHEECLHLFVFAGLGVEPSASCTQCRCSVPKPGSQPWRLFIVFSIRNMSALVWKLDCPCIGKLLIWFLLPLLLAI